MTACPLCGRPTDDATAHPACVAGLDGRLQRIPVLYRMLADVLEPGAAVGTRVSGSRTAPIPVRLEPLSLRARGGIIAILATWETDWRDRRGWAPVPARADREQLVDGDQALADIVRFLSAHLPWAVRSHPAVDEFAGEIGDIVGACLRVLGLVNNAYRIGQCPAQLGTRTCGRVLYADPYATAIRCDRCHTEWPRTRWLLLGATIAATTH